MSVKPPQASTIFNPPRTELPKIDSPIERLREIDPDLRVLRRSTNRNIRVRRRLQTSQAIANNKDSSAESAERAIQDTGPSDQAADAVQAKAPDESGFVAVVAKYPVGVAEGRERVGAEVGGLQARRASTRNFEDVLKMFV